MEIEQEVKEFLVLDKDAILETISPNVIAFLKRRRLFSRGYLLAYNFAFRDFIYRQIFSCVQDRFSLNFEETSVILDSVSIPDAYFQESSYEDSSNGK